MGRNHTSIIYSVYFDEEWGKGKRLTALDGVKHCAAFLLSLVLQHLGDDLLFFDEESANNLLSHGLVAQNTCKKSKDWVNVGRANC